MKLLLLDTRGMVIQSLSVVGSLAMLPFFRTISGISRRYRVGQVVACWDRKPEFKISISKDYKQARREKREVDLDWSNLINSQCDLAFGLLYRAGARQMWAKGFEADDVIYTLVERFKDTADHVYVCTRDHDLFQVVGPKVSLILPQGIEADEEYVKIQTGLAPNYWVDYLALAGCSGDGVKGVHGIGDKRAVEIVKKFGHTSEILKRNDLGFKLPEDWKEQLKKAYKLVSLYGIPMPMMGMKEGEKSWHHFDEVAVNGGVPNLSRGDRLREIREVFGG